MRRFKWIDWNLAKIAAHSLSPEEVEDAFARIHQLEERQDASFEMIAETPSGRVICVIWRYDREHDSVPDVFSDMEDAAIFVITAY